MGADFARAARCAVELLLRQRLYSPRIDVRKLVYKQRIIFDTFAHYCEVSRAALPELRQYADMRDGCTLRRSGAGERVYIVLYDAAVNPMRTRFTLAHEVAHICLEHETDGSGEEAEANHFASCLLTPPALVWELLQQSEFRISPEEIAEIFEVSKSAAENSLRVFSRGRAPVFSVEEQEVLKKFGGLLPQARGPVVDL